MMKSKQHAERTEMNLRRMKIGPNLLKRSRRLYNMKRKSGKLLEN